MFITQVSPEETAKVCVIESTGYYVRDHGDCIVLAGDLVDGDYRRVLVIPRENIVKMKVLK